MVISRISDDENPSKKKQKNTDAKISLMREELKQLLSKPLVAQGISARYITSSSRNIVDDLIGADGLLVLLS